MQQILHKIIIIVLAFVLLSQWAAAQKMSHLDSIRTGKIDISEYKFINNFFKDALNSIEKTASTNDLSNLNIKSETPFLPYQGKIIRHINILPYNFERTFKDTSKRDNSKAARIGKDLHYVTKEYVIRNNLFVKENTPLSAFKLADNERYIRTLNYLHDVRIIVKSLKNNPDSVDIIIFTIDVFSIAGGMAINNYNNFNVNAYETNFGGSGQRIDLSTIYNYNRSPNVGMGVAYKWTNVLHSFTDATFGYSTTNNSGLTHEEESTAYISLSKQLISPNTRTAGGLTLSHNEAGNLYHVPDSVFYKYNSNLFDVWGGYNLGLKQLTAHNNTIRDRKFLSVRLYTNQYKDVPYQVGKSFNPVFNNTIAALSKITFFRQDYYRTQYIYGFGTTEDLPYGYNVALTTGWYKQLWLQRPYAGLNANDYIATNRGDFLQFFIRTGGFLNNGTIQDRSLLIGVTMFSRIIFWNSTKIRQYFNFNYSRIDNMVTVVPLKINNDYGIRGFLSDSAYGRQRITLQSETEFFIKFSIYGFHFAPFPYIDLSLITPKNESVLKSTLYYGVGGGIRARNENLVFETIELKAYYFPVAPNNMNGFKIVLNTNVRFRYSSNFITEPDIVQLNSVQ